MNQNSLVNQHYVSRFTQKSQNRLVFPVWSLKYVIYGI